MSLFVFAGKSRHEYIKETFETSGDGSLRIIQVIEIISRPSLVNTAVCGVQNFHSFSSKTACQIVRPAHEYDCFASVWIQPFFLKRTTFTYPGAPNGNFRENICSEDDLRPRIFGAFVVKFLACLPLLGFSKIYKMVKLPIFNGF